MNRLYCDSDEGDSHRQFPKALDYRSVYRRDLARLIHSACFRRLQGKTQLFSSLESDFFRNRLTHSIEVAHISRSIAIKLNQTEALKNLGWAIDLDLVEFAGLAHDLGHPPFGHTGEQALHALMAEWGGFEGNAQTLRLLTRLENRVDDPDKQLFDGSFEFYDKDGKDSTVGQNLTARSLAAILKYDTPIQGPTTARAEFAKGFYASEQPIVDSIRRSVLGSQDGAKLRTIECQIMDMADDIAYSTYDIEDAFAAGFVAPLDFLFPAPNSIATVCDKVKKEIDLKLDEAQVKETVTDAFKKIAEGSLGDAYGVSKQYRDLHHFRTSVASWLVNSAIAAISIKPNEECPPLSELDIEPKEKRRVSVLKHLTYELIIKSPQLQLVSHRGEQIVRKLFKTFLKSPNLLSPEYSARFEQAPKCARPRVVADYIACLTDRHATELYARLTSEDFRSIFQPH